MHQPATKIANGAFLGDFSTLTAEPNQLRWNPPALPAADKKIDFIQGLFVCFDLFFGDFSPLKRRKLFRINDILWHRRCDTENWRRDSLLHLQYVDGGQRLL